MKGNVLLNPTRIYWQLIVMISITDFLSEFVMERELARIGITPGGFGIHFTEFVVVMIISMPLILVWVRLHWVRIANVQQHFMESQQDYRSLFEHNPYAVYSINLLGQIDSINPAFYRLTGYTQDDLVEKKPPFSLLVQEDREKAMDCFRRSVNGNDQRLEARLVTKAGETLDLDVTFQPKYRNNKIVGIYAMVQDLTPRKRTERKLRDLQEMFTSLFDTTSDALMVFQPHDRKVLHVNRAFEQLYGWTAGEVVGNPIPAVIPLNRSSEVNHMIGTILSANVVSAVDTIRLRKDGVELDVNVTVAPIHDSEGQLVAIGGLSRDISKHKAMARELEEAKHRFESLIQNTADAISMIDLGGNVLMVNPAWENVYGWTAEEVIGKSSPTIFGLKDTDFVDVKKQIQGGKVFRREVFRLRSDGTTIEVSETISPVLSSDGQVVSIAFIAKDLTELRKTEEMMLRSDKLALAGELAAAVAHEIRNPLTTIQGFLQLMYSHFDPSYLDLLINEVKRINEITDEFLVLSKQHTEHHTLVDVRDVLQEVLTLMGTQANMYGISIHTQYATKVPMVFCSPNQMKQVFINLIKNAIEAMEKGGNIDIKVGPTPHGLEVLLSDDGPGIPPERLRHLGEPFYTTKDRGTGLGLMVTYRIIQNHQGTIQASSKLGHGTRFRIMLPHVLPHETLNA